MSPGFALLDGQPGRRAASPAARDRPSSAGLPQREGDSDIAVVDEGVEGAGVPLGDIQAFLAIYDAISELKSKNAETSERVEAVMELSGGAMEATSGLGDRGSKITKPAAGGKALASENAGGLAGGLSGATDFFGVIKGSRASSLAPGRSWTS